MIFRYMVLVCGGTALLNVMGEIREDVVRCEQKTIFNAEVCGYELKGLTMISVLS